MDTMMKELCEELLGAAINLEMIENRQASRAVSRAITMLQAKYPTDGDAISRSALLAAYDAAHKGPPGGARKLIEEAPPVVSMAPAPRVMSLYEVAKMAADYHDCMLWFEPKEIDDEMWFMAYAQPVESDETDIHIYEFGNDVPIEAKKYLYGKTWRCWTDKPTDAQRESAPWEG